MPVPAIPTPIACPKCQHRYVVPLRTVVDVGQEPELKEEFLRGRLNRARCPQCGAEGLLSVPLVYHDPEKELLITYVPGELTMPVDEREKYIGSLVRTVMNGVPQEQRKGYFLHPQSAATLDNLYDMVLEADGVSREELARQRAQVRLIQDLLAVADDDTALDELVAKHREELDYSFFLILSAMIDQDAGDGAQAAGAAEEVAALKNLRERLLQRVTPRMPGAAPENATYDDLIQLLRDAEPGAAFTRALTANRRRLDYGFFLALTARIDAARAAGNTAEAEALTALRQRINEGLDQQAELIRAVEDQATLLIMELSDADDPEAAAREHKDELNEIVLAVLARYLAAAEEGSKRHERLERVLEAITNVLDEDLSPEQRLVSRLARADYPDGTGAILEENRRLLSDAFLKEFDALAETVQGDAALARHLQDVRGQIVAKMLIQRA